MMRKKCIISALLIVTGVVWSTATYALWNPLWEVSFVDALDTGGTILKDSYAIGAGGNGTDVYGLAEDILKVYPPGWPDTGYSGPVFTYVGMESTVSGVKLAKDARAAVVGGTVWNIDKVAGAAVAGTETISWDVSDTNIPGALPLTLIDYGTDSSRTSAVTSVNMKTQSSYVVAVSGGPGTYRYLQVLAGSAPAAAPVVSISVSGNDAILKWVSDGGATYAVYYTNDLNAGWTLAQGGIAGTGAEIVWTDTGGAGQIKRFYKVEVY